MKRKNYINPISKQPYNYPYETGFGDPMTVVEKINDIVLRLNKYGDLNEEMLKKWNDVYRWVMNEGLDSAVGDRLKEWLEKGILEDLINESLGKNINEVREIVNDFISFYTKESGSFLLNGGVLDGETDNTDVFNTMLDVDKPNIKIGKGKAFVKTIGLEAKKDIVISGEGKDQTFLVSDRNIIKTLNTPTKETQMVGGAKEGDSSVRLQSTGNIGLGDLIVLLSPELMKTTSGEHRLSHSAKVTHVTGSVVYLDKPFPDNFSNTYNVDVEIYKTGSIEINNMTIEGQFDGFFIDLIYTSGLSFNNVIFRNTNKGYQGTIFGGSIGVSGGEMKGTRVRYSTDIVFNNCYFDHLSYGVMPTRGSVGVEIRNSTALRCRHISAPTGTANKTKMINCQTHGCYAGFDSHQSSYETRAINCSSYDDEIPSKFRGVDDVVKGCLFTNGLEMRGFYNGDRKRIKKIIDSHIVGNVTLMSTEIGLISNSEIKGVLYSVYVTESMSVVDTEITVDVFKYYDDFTSPKVSFIFRLSDSKKTEIRNVILNGAYKDIDQTDGSKSDYDFRAFSLTRGKDINLVSIDNVVINGFDVGFDMPTTKDLKRYDFNNIAISNCVEGINTSQNYKYNVNIERVYFDGCGVDITAEYRLKKGDTI